MMKLKYFLHARCYASASTSDLAGLRTKPRQCQIIKALTEAVLVVPGAQYPFSDAEGGADYLG